MEECKSTYESSQDTAGNQPAASATGGQQSAAQDAGRQQAAVPTAGGQPAASATGGQQTAAPTAGGQQASAPTAGEQDVALGQQSAAQDVLERLLLAHEAYFDVERGYEYEGQHFEGYAEFHSSTSQYVLAKRAKLWEANSHEYMFFTTVEHLDAQTLNELLAFMQTKALNKVELGKDHMSSYLTLIVIAQSSSPEIPKLVRKTRFRKNYMFGLKGWADLRVCVIDLLQEAVYTNAQGKDLIPTLEANAFKIS